MQTIGSKRRKNRTWRLWGLLATAGAVGLGVYVAQRGEADGLPAAEISPSWVRHDGMLLIPAGTFSMGSDFAADTAQQPAHEVSLRAFWMDEHAVTNSQFAEFVAETGYVTTAEQAAGAWVFSPASGGWRLLAGACWRRPEGPGDEPAGREQRPVVQVSWLDAAAYADWAGKRLPTEAEFEYAARGGLHDADYPWGRDELPDGTGQANYWRVSGDERPRALLSVKSFSPNGFGLHDMTGHVWQWCGDWYAADYYTISPTENPPGARDGRRRVIRGGSWVGAEKEIAGYTVSLRTGKRPAACYHHIGFRCVKDSE
ncbi:MAG: formylglycine-generating enzyme family protein [Planctomycetes bacterium]|nr:formylglycine-generating enzyme family protein [Planctomycetota bacterium]